MSSDGLAELFANLDSLPERVEKTLTRKAFKEIGAEQVEKAKNSAPVRVGDITTTVGKTHTRQNRRGRYGTWKNPNDYQFTTIRFDKPGQLRDSIKYSISTKKKAGGIILTVGTNVFYARFVEYGFMHYAIKTTPTHVPARPYLTPVLESSFDSVMNRMTQYLFDNVGNEMEKAAKRAARSS